MDLLVTTNSTGKRGCCIELDMCCEHKVRSVKGLFRSMHNQLESTLIAKAVMAQNSSTIISDHFYDCIGRGDLKSGGHHRNEYLQDEEKKLIHSEFIRLQMFSQEESREKKHFNMKIRRVWEDLTNDNIDVFLDRNCGDYKLKRRYRFH